MGENQPTTENKRFGTFLRGLREERRLSLDAVEEMSTGLTERVTKSHLSRIENGRAIPTFPRMFALSQIYGIPVAYLAERFEISLMRKMFPPEAAAMPAAEALAAARALEIQGRFAEALSILEAALDRQRTSDGPSEQRIEIELHCVHALTKLGRWATAKEDCERLLSSPDLTARQKVIAMQSLAVCCYKLGKYPVALMVIAHAESEVDKLEDVGSLRVLLTVLKGNVQFAMKQFEEAVEAFRDGVNRYEALGYTFETCRTRLNLAVGLIELGSRSRAREILGQASRTAEANGYERQQAYALGHLGALAFREGDLDGSEAHCLRSNTIARPREYLTILWRNCYYLWRIGRVRNDAVGVNSAERTMKTYLNRVEGYVSELQDYRLFLSEGKKDE